MGEMTELPSEFPSAAATALLPFLRGKLPSDAAEKRLAYKAGWNVVGYAGNIGFPAQVGGQQRLYVDKKDIADELEMLCRAGSGQAMAMGSFPFRRLLELLLPLLLEWAA